MRYGKLAVLSAAVVFAGCGGSAVDQQYVESIPDMPGMALEVTGGADEGLSTAGLSSAGLGDGAAAEVGEVLQDAVPAPVNVPEFLAATRAHLKELNEHLRRALDQVTAIASSTPGQPVAGQPGVRVWGPRDANGLTWRLFIRRFSETKYGFRLDAKPVGGEDSAYKIIMGGALTRGAVAHRGAGTVGVDLDNLKAVDAAFKGQGKLLAGFAHAGETKTLLYGLKEFTPDLTAHPAVTATFAGHKAASGERVVRVAGHINLANAGASPTDRKELVRVRVRHMPGVGGRGDIFATGGDIEDGVYYWGAACWNAQEEEAFKVLVRCSRTGPDATRCNVVFTRGERTACALGFREDNTPPESLTDPTVEAGAPTTDVALPAVVSDGVSG